MRKIALLSLVAVAFIINGCSSKEEVKPIVKKFYLKKPKAYTFNYIPIIGTQTPDDKVVVDMGVVLRVWINSYKTKANDLVSSHDIYMWAKKPDFIAGNELPYKKRGMLTATGKLPFMLSNENVDRSDTSDNINIRNFVNSYYEKKSDFKYTETDLDNSKQYDKLIKDFIKQNKQEK